MGKEINLGTLWPEGEYEAAIMGQAYGSEAAYQAAKLRECIGDRVALPMSAILFQLREELDGRA